ncbi:hypothetical protein GDO78_012164 [Eleutherodactylus coqui]|uniref:Uncharacterized protein n=1 Tax=Eleutherodactylus coqui TaxID=57060 RepID=A0A8J6K5G3_ELECQ|nr:hypothetical protein GDO78_012164 [Eleutherodactylus coqui]
MKPRFRTQYSLQLKSSFSQMRTVCAVIHNLAHMKSDRLFVPRYEGNLERIAAMVGQMFININRERKTLCHPIESYTSCLVPLLKGLYKHLKVVSQHRG